VRFQSPVRISALRIAAPDPSRATPSQNEKNITNAGAAQADRWVSPDSCEEIFFGHAPIDRVGKKPGLALIEAAVARTPSKLRAGR